ncbi:hypothetical protein AVEN_4459-1 [Araneus ventricosus]|uniref:Uncharacterized protein n=1 Tax=Araneus ventricosus TaxID=182803 RepID=A0A4Y2TLU9_ARAVE|nr:hypothetical protein AVEN_4459-1 [Araneus ventricosus]
MFGKEVCEVKKDSCPLLVDSHLPIGSAEFTLTMSSDIHLQTWSVHLDTNTERLAVYSQVAKKAGLKGFGNLVLGKGKGLSQRFP